MPALCSLKKKKSNARTLYQKKEKKKTEGNVRTKDSQEPFSLTCFLPR